MDVNKTPFTIHIIGPFIKHDIGNSIYDECNISITCPCYPVHLDNIWLCTYPGPLRFVGLDRMSEMFTRPRSVTERGRARSNATFSWGGGGVLGGARWRQLVATMATTILPGAQVTKSTPRRGR